MSAAISFEWGKTVCLIGKGQACCRYVTGDLSKGGLLECAKHNRRLSAYLDRRVAEGNMIARGDNCPGLPLRH